MYIKPISKFSLAKDIVSANYQRRLEINKVIDDRRLVDNIFSNLKYNLDHANSNAIEYILSYDLFFEVIPDECIKLLLSVYSNLNIDNKEHYVNLLKESYIIRGRKGFVFSFMPIINRF